MGKVYALLMRSQDILSKTSLLMIPKPRSIPQVMLMATLTCPFFHLKTKFISSILAMKAYCFAFQNSNRQPNWHSIQTPNDSEKLCFPSAEQEMRKNASLNRSPSFPIGILHLSFPIPVPNCFERLLGFAFSNRKGVAEVQ